MNAWQGFKIWRELKRRYAEVSAVETRKGIYTTEFWLTAIVSVLDVAGMVAGMLPPEQGAVILAIVNAAYNIARGISKHGVPNQPPTTGG